MDLSSAVTFDDNERQEYYIINGGVAVIHSYVTDTWFIYRDFDVTHMFAAGRALYGTTTDGDIVKISRRYTNDNGRPIVTLWRSGSIGFARDWQRKFVSRLFVTMKPEARSMIIATIRTNRDGGATRRVVSQGLATFANANFKSWSFRVNRQPQTRRFRVKARKLTYLQLSFGSDTDWSTATILAAHLRVMFAGDVRN
jgi:hypothetical protein